MSFDKASIDKNIPIPLYYQLKQVILQKIEQGELKPGDSIPTEIELNALFDVSRTTIRQAIIELVREGYLYRVKGKGTFVAEPKLPQDFMQKLEPFNDQIRRLDMTPSTKILDFTTAAAPQMAAEALGLRTGAEVVHLKRLRYANETPIVIVDTFLPIDCRAILTEDIAQEGLYKLLARVPGTRVVRARREVEAVMATEEDCRLLNIAKRSAIQKTVTTGFNQAGQPIEYSVAHYRGDKNVFVVESLVDV